MLFSVAVPGLKHLFFLGQQPGEWYSLGKSVSSLIEIGIISSQSKKKPGSGVISGLDETSVLFTRDVN